MAGLGWYGPLIDLSCVSFHVDDFVQLLVFVHRSNPVQHKLVGRGGGGGGGGRNVIRTDIHVGDETRPFFAVSLWNKHLASSVSARHVILLQNVKVTKFGGVIEARTVQCSSVICLIHPYDSLLTKDVDELMGDCRIAGTAKDKLRRVIQWVQRSRSTLCNELKGGRGPALRNWKADQDQKPRECYLLSEVLRLDNSCKAIFHASVGEMFLPSTWYDKDRERMFISKRVTSSENCLVDDMICTGCQLCGSPLSSDSSSVQNASFFHCKLSSNQVHTVGLIYRPFVLYVWDISDYIPLLVRNKAAEILFGNISAEKVYQSYKTRKDDTLSRPPSMDAAKANKSKETGKQIVNGSRCPDFLAIWLILVKMLLQQAKNSPLQFEAQFTPSLEVEDGRFEMIGMSMPCLINHSISENQEHELGLA